MEQQIIWKYKELYSLYMKLKSNGSGQDYIVILPDNKDRRNAHGKDGTVFT